MRGPGVDIGPAADAAQGAGAPSAVDEARCQAAGDLIGSALPGQPSLVPPPAWDALRAALADGAAARPVSPRPRRRWLIPALAGVAAVAAAIVLARRPALRFDVDGAAVGAGGRIEAAAGRPATLRFSDGTAIALAGGSAGRVTDRAPEGATFALERGRASFDVVHRPRARWRVAVGPFEVLVTGTRFDVDWSADGERTLEVDLHAGSVIVRGALAGVVDGEASSAAAPPAPVPSVPAPIDAEAAAGAAGPPAPGADRRRGHRERGAPDEIIDVVPEPVPLEPPPPRSPGVRIGTAPRSGMFMSAELAAGGGACMDWAPQIRFDQTIDGAYATSITALALSHTVWDHTRSWCGSGSLRADATFDVLGAPNHINVRPHEVGSVVVKLGTPTDFTGKTISAHVYVEAPPGVVFGAQIFVINAVNGINKWVNGGPLSDLQPGRWLTIVSRTYEQQNWLFEGGTSPVDHADSLAIQIYAEGSLRAWTGKVYVDDIGWR
jgi:hypothetical protein